MDKRRTERLREYADIMELHAHRLAELVKDILCEEPEPEPKSFDFRAMGPISFEIKEARPEPPPRCSELPPEPPQESPSQSASRDADVPSFADLASGAAPGIVPTPDPSSQPLSLPAAGMSAQHEDPPSQPDPDRDAALLALNIHIAQQGKKACEKAIGVPVADVMDMPSAGIWDHIKVLDHDFPSEPSSSPEKPPQEPPETLGDAIGEPTPPAPQDAAEALPKAPTRGQLKNAIQGQLDRLGSEAAAWLGKRRGDRADDPVSRWAQSNGTLQVWLTELEAIPTPEPVAVPVEQEDELDPQEDSAKLALLCKAVEAELSEETIVEARGRSGVEEYADLPSLPAAVLRIYRGKLDEALRALKDGEE